jgi:hypothetical protein
MAITNNRIFGLAVPLSLADIPDRQEALLNLGLNQEDFEIIRGIDAAGFDSNDLQTLSNLSTPIYKTFDRYISDVLTYNTGLGDSSGSDIVTRGNLEVLGPILATSFRYSLLDTLSEANPVLRWGDISTSRVSSWSAIGDTIAYGGDIDISGKLSVGKLKTSSTPTLRTFLAESVTHKIAINLNGSTRYIYAMKGIPIRFRGYFRNLTASIGLNTSVAPPSAWRIYNVGTTSYADYQDSASSSTTNLDYKSPSAAERNIEIYINPTNIDSFTLQQSNIIELPKTRLINCKTFLFAENGLTTFPNFTFLTPALTTLTLDDNKFFNATAADERYFGRKIAEKLPSTLVSLNVRGCFVGTLLQNVLNKFTQLRTFNAQRTALNPNSIFYATAENPAGELPNFYGKSNDDTTQQIRNVYLYDNGFDTIGTGLQGGADTVSVTQSGTGYPPGEYKNIVVDATKGFSIDFAVVSTGQINPSSVRVNNPGSGGYSLSPTAPVFSVPSVGNPATGSGGQVTVTSLIFTQNIKQQTKLINISIGENNNLLDSNFSLACKDTLVNLDCDRTRLSLPNVQDFSALQRYNFYGGSNKKSLYTGWDNGQYGDPSQPTSDTSGFKLLNCKELLSVSLGESDVSGYFPKFSGCSKLNSINFYACNNIIAGRPAKRGIVKLFDIGAISTIGTFSVTGTTGEFQRNLDVIAFDTTPPAGGSPASVRVTTNSTGDITSITLVNRGSKYTTSETINIAGTDLSPISPAAAGNKNVVIQVSSIVQSVIGDAQYPGAVGTNTYSDLGLGTGKDAKIRITFNASGNISSYEVQTPGKEYQDFDYDNLTRYVEISGVSLGGGSNLKIRIQTVESPKLIYNDTLQDNPAVSYFDLRVNNVNFRGNAETNAFLPCKDALSIFRFGASGRATGSFFNLDSHSALTDVYSPFENWSGNVPSFTNSFNMSIIRLQYNKFTGSISYSTKSKLYYMDYSFNKIEGISSTAYMPALKYLYLSDNQIGVNTGTENFPRLDVICPIVQEVQLQNNRISTYTNGVVDLAKLTTLDLSGNRMSQGQVDAILYDLEKNYDKYPRSGVTINLRGSQMGAPTPYPIVTGVISGVTTTNNVVINSSGTVIDLKDAIGSSGYVPISGTYSNRQVQYESGSGTGSGGTVSLTVTTNFKKNVITTINSADFTFSSGQLNPNVTQTYDVTDTGANANGTGASIRVVVAPATTNPTTNPSRITSITLLSGGQNYVSTDKITIPLGSIGGADGFLLVNITAVKKRVYSSVTWSYTINSGGSNYVAGVTQMKTPTTIVFEDDDGNQQFGYIRFRVSATSSFTNTSVKTGFGVAEYLRKRGWSVQTN